MKIRIYNHHGNWKHVKTGKGHFVVALIHAFTRLGHDVVCDLTGPVDISLGIGKFVDGDAPAKKRVLRLGASHIGLTGADYKKLNKPKRKAQKQADGVVYQSRFSQQMSESFIGKFKGPKTIILNGAMPSSVEPVESPYTYNLVACTRVWTPQKRLEDTIMAFYFAKVPNSCLWIIGEHDGIGCNSPHSRSVGIISHEDLPRYYKMADVMIDFSYANACPNACVEALVNNCPVICTSMNGTAELPGTIAVPDKPWDFKSLKKVPSVNIDAAANAIKAAFWITPLQALRSAMAKYLHIDNIAKQYIAFFKEVL